MCEELKDAGACYRSRRIQLTTGVISLVGLMGLNHSVNGRVVLQGSSVENLLEEQSSLRLTVIGQSGTQSGAGRDRLRRKLDSVPC